jgi:hypothetical protein
MPGGRYVDAAGLKTYILELGSGEPLILLQWP